MKHTLLILLSLFLVSCQSADKRKKDEITRLVNEWQGKEIVFPKGIIFTRFSTDTVDYQVPESEYKVLIYVDSMGCTSCKLQLLKWKELIAYTDSLTNGSIPFLFFIHPKDYKEMYYILDMNSFDHPICIDIEDVLNKLNNFPDDMNFQVFLLDRSNKVIVIGNPVHNKSVKELYIKQLNKKIEVQTE